jgi:hypothetical protein
MPSKITVEIAGLIGEAAIGEMIRNVTAAYATQVQAKLAEDKPPPPGRGKMVWKSDKQRRYVMGAWKRGEIKIPYVRGSAASGSGSGGLNKSYRLDLKGDEAYLTTPAAYAIYVVGDKQAAIHQGRWNTALNAAEQVRASGDLNYIVQKAMEKL